MIDYYLVVGADFMPRRITGEHLEHAAAKTPDIILISLGFAFQ
jgi:hypothetical protein